MHATDLKKELSKKLLKQEFVPNQSESDQLEQYKQMAISYTYTENAIAVLSDMKANRSYIYYGGIAKTLGITPEMLSQTVQSIWEEAIFSRIHPDDLRKKHLQELHFFHFLKKYAPEQRKDYCLLNPLRMKDESGAYHTIIHRMIYIASTSSGSIWLALCLYNLSDTAETGSKIINTLNGLSIKYSEQNCNPLLSEREKEILALIGQGKMSKDIASSLSISLNTVNRHRQNILQKLQVSNSVQAYQTAKNLGLL